MIEPLDEISVPLLCHHSVEVIVREGGRDLGHRLYFVMLEKVHHLLEASRFHLDEFDVLGARVFVLLAGLGVLHHLGETRGGVGPGRDWEKNDEGKAEVSGRGACPAGPRSRDLEIKPRIPLATPRRRDAALQILTYLASFPEAAGMAPRLIMPAKMTAVNSQFKFVSIAGYELDRRRVRIVHGCVAAFVCVYLCVAS